VRSARDLVALAKSKPGQINYGSSGTGAITHLSMEFFKAKTKTDMVHIPYKGANISLTELVGGQVIRDVCRTGFDPEHARFAARARHRHRRARTLAAAARRTGNFRKRHHRFRGGQLVRH